MLHVPRFSALASPLPVTLPTTLAAGFAYRGEKLIDWWIVRIICVVGVPATIAGSLGTELVGGHPLMVMTALFVLSLGVSFLVSGTQVPAEDSEPLRPHLWRTSAVAAGVGFLSGLLANSGGILFGPLFIRYLHVPTKRALATSLIASSVLSIPGTIVHAYLGHIEWILAWWLAAGTIPFSYLGARLAVRMQSATLERIYGIALIVLGIYDLLWTERKIFWR
jgi:uncharacterized membrane protein YfcA